MDLLVATDILLSRERLAHRDLEGPQVATLRSSWARFINFTCQEPLILRISDKCLRGHRYTLDIIIFFVISLASFDMTK